MSRSPLPPMLPPTPLLRRLVSPARTCRRCVTTRRPAAVSVCVQTRHESSSSSTNPGSNQKPGTSKNHGPDHSPDPLAREYSRKPLLVRDPNSRWRAVGPFSLTGVVLFVITGAAMTWYFDREKTRAAHRRKTEKVRGVGRARIGGPFSLIDQHGHPFTSDDLRGRHALIYFGFTRCPDICPDELDKMSRMIDLVEAERPGALAPVFVTCDPARDTPDIIRPYLAEFHPRLIGLTGTYAQIKDMCHAYRVYFSTPENVSDGKDYLVDHSIYFYLMDPDGGFVEALGRQHSPEDGAKVMLDNMQDWQKGIRYD